jgi:hypothetical protein
MSLYYRKHRLYPQKLALTSPTCGGPSVGIVRLWAKATEFSLVNVDLYSHSPIRLHGVVLN